VMMYGNKPKALAARGTPMNPPSTSAGRHPGRPSSR
jgi:hypothetical protein